MIKNTPDTATHLLLLGTHPRLSLAEVAKKLTTVRYDDHHRVLLAKDLQYFNPRNIPRDKDQLFLDALGGTIRMAQVMGVYASIGQLLQAATKHLKPMHPGFTLSLGVTGFGVPRRFIQDFTQSLTRALSRRIRVVTKQGQPLTSAIVFQEKLLKKGAELIVYKTPQGYLLANTTANQNLRNYTLRDHRKPFRDAHMGMLPPKLAQILINLGVPSPDNIILDPFCGSGTVNTEAAIMGYTSEGSDQSAERIAGAKQNVEFLAQKFRFAQDSIKLSAKDATTRPYPKKNQTVIATEGWLGTNFTAAPNQKDAQKSLQIVTKVWAQVFSQLQGSSVHTVVCCLPHLGPHGGILKKTVANAQKAGYTPRALFGGKVSYVYARPGAYVSREIVVFSRKS